MNFDADTVTGRWDYATLPSNVRLGTGCFIERQASFSRYRSREPLGLELGNDVTVYTWTEFNVEPSGAVKVGDGSVLVGAIFMCALSITIGERVIISYHVTIADSDFHSVDPVARREDAIANAPGASPKRAPSVDALRVQIDDDAWIGIGAIILKGVHIGRGARVMPGAVVTRDVPAGAVVRGNPARVEHL